MTSPTYARRTLPRPRYNGFTLLELLLVTTLIALLATEAAPRLSGTFHALAFRDSQERLVAEIRAARLEALRKQVPIRFEVYPDSGEYGFRKVSGPSGHATGPTVFGDSFWDERRSLPSGVTLDRIEQEGRPLQPMALIFPASGTMPVTRMRLLDKDGKAGTIELGTWVDEVRMDSSDAAASTSRGTQ